MIHYSQGYLFPNSFDSRNKTNIANDMAVMQKISDQLSSENKIANNKMAQAAASPKKKHAYIPDIQSDVPED